MIKTTTFLASLILLPLPAQSALILTGIYDGQSSTPKGIEIYVTTTGSYSGWTVDEQFNGGSTWRTDYTFDDTSYTAGSFIYLTSTSDDTVITSQTGIIIDDGSFTANGNDSVRIQNGTNTIDQHGASNTDGTGTAWEYTDSYASRKSGTSASGAYVFSDWTYGGTNVLDSGNAPLSATLGTYTVPEPSSLTLIGLTMLLRRKR